MDLHVYRTNKNFNQSNQGQETYMVKCFGEVGGERFFNLSKSLVKQN